MNGWNALSKEELITVCEITFERILPKMLEILNKMTSIIGDQLMIKSALDKVVSEDEL